jgi:alpha-tubulin suppressor-like RCC1 family protein
MFFHRGSNSEGQLGNGTAGASSDVLVPTPVVAGGLKFGGVTASFNFTCADELGGGIYCWGANSIGQLGNGSSGHRVTPALVAGTRGP